MGALLAIVIITVQEQPPQSRQQSPHSALLASIFYGEYYSCFLDFSPFSINTSVKPNTSGFWLFLISKTKSYVGKKYFKTHWKTCISHNSSPVSALVKAVLRLFLRQILVPCVLNTVTSVSAKGGYCLVLCCAIYIHNGCMRPHHHRLTYSSHAASTWLHNDKINNFSNFQAAKFPTMNHNKIHGSCVPSLLWEAPAEHTCWHRAALRGVGSSQAIPSSRLADSPGAPRPVACSSAASHVDLSSYIFICMETFHVVFAC